MLDFFEETQQDIVKVILIEGVWQNVSETKKTVYQKYKQYIDSGTIHLQHVSEQYVSKVAKLSARQKIQSYKHYVEEIRASIPLHDVEDIVRNAADRSLAKEKIIDLCCDAYIDDIGSTNSDPQVIRSIFNLTIIKSELKKLTIESIKESLGSELSAEIKRHFEFKLEASLQLHTVIDAINFAIAMLLTSILILISTIFLPLAIVAAVATGLVTIFTGPDVNSRSWREGVAKEIYEEIYNKKYTIVHRISSHLRQSFRVTSDQLNNVAERLDDFIRRIDSID